MAGYDTTAFSLTWTLYLISQSPRMGSAHARRGGTGRRLRPSDRRACRPAVTVQQVLNESFGCFRPRQSSCATSSRTWTFDGDRISGRHDRNFIPIYAIHRHHQPTVEGARPIRPRPLRSQRFATSPSRFPVHAFRGGTAHLHRRRVRDHRGNDHAGPLFVRAARFEPVPDFNLRSHPRACFCCRRTGCRCGLRCATAPRA